MAFWRRRKSEGFSSSVLGLDKTVEELKARDEAVEMEFGVRFSWAIEKTRASIDSRLVKETPAATMIDRIRSHVRAQGYHISDGVPDPLFNIIGRPGCITGIGEICFAEID